MRQSTDWNQVDALMAEEALKNDLFSVCARYQGKTIGIGRVIGDGAIYFYIQDVIVLPEYRTQGVGTLIMERIEAYLDGHAKEGAFIGLMAAEGVVSFYRKFGYSKRPEGRPGMYKYR